MSIFVKTYIYMKVELGNKQGWREFKKLDRVVFSTNSKVGFESTLWRYYDNMILWYTLYALYTLYTLYTVYTVYTLYTLVISVEDDLSLGLSASKMTYL